MEVFGPLTPADCASATASPEAPRKDLLVFVLLWPVTRTREVLEGIIAYAERDPKRGKGLEMVWRMEAADRLVSLICAARTACGGRVAVKNDERR